MLWEAPLGVDTHQVPEPSEWREPGSRHQVPRGRDTPRASMSATLT